MTEVVRVEVGQRPRALRLHPAPAGSSNGPPPAPAVAQLIALRDAAVAEAESAAALVRASDALQQGLAELPRLVESELRDVALSAAELGLAVARSLADGALQLGQFDPAPIVERCLREVVDERGGVGLCVRVAAADAERIGAGLSARHGQPVRVIADPDLPRGSVRVESDGGGAANYDLRAVCERVTQRIREELTR